MNRHENIRWKMEQLNEEIDRDMRNMIKEVLKEHAIKININKLNDIEIFIKKMEEMEE